MHHVSYIMNQLRNDKYMSFCKIDVRVRDEEIRDYNSDTETQIMIKLSRTSAVSN